MRLHLLLPKVEPKAIPIPSKCAYADCSSKQVRLHQPVRKALRDTVHRQVEVHRYRCLKCGRTFRVYPPGVSHAQSSDRVKGLAVLLYLLGLSYGAVSLALESLGVPLCKTEVYETVQAVAARVPGLKREQVFQGVKTVALGGDLTSVKCAGQWLHLGLTVDSLSGLALTIDEVSAEDAATLKAWIEPIAASVGAQVLVTDDADGFKTTADELGRLASGVQKSCEAQYPGPHPGVTSAGGQGWRWLPANHWGGVCPSRRRLSSPGRTDRQPTAGARQGSGGIASSLSVGCSSQERGGGEPGLSAAALVSGSLEPVEPPDALSQVAWTGASEQLDGTNNACERAIGWWIKERYRSMRGYKVPANALRVSRLLA